MVSSTLSPAATSPSRNSMSPPHTRKRDGRYSGSSGGAFGLFRRKKKTYNAFSRTNRKSNANANSNLDIVTLPEESGDDEEDDGASCSTAKMAKAGGSVKIDGVEARSDSSSNDQIDDLAQIVQTLERTIRQVVLYCIIFIAGAKSPPDIIPKIGKLLELSTVAWGTCLLIFGLGWLQSRKHNDNVLLIPRQSIIPLAVSSLSDAETPVKVDLHSSVGEDEDAAVLSSHQKQHSCFDNLYIMLGPKQRVYPNIVATNFDNELFHGRMLLMFRTPDVDEGIMQPSENPMVSYFRGKQRRFEFQWQFKLKKIPEGDVFFSAELDEPIHFGVIQRALTNTALKFVKKMNQGFSYFISESQNYPSYLSFPVSTSMDRLTASKPGQPLPELGKEIIEDKSAMKERKKGRKVEWNVDDVYTMSLWSAYFDWADWQLMNFPGIPKLDVTSVAGIQPIKLNLYTTPGVSGSVAGKDVNRHIISSIEVSNTVKSTLGKNAKEWVKTGDKSDQISKIELPDLDLEEKSADLANLDVPETFEEDSEDSLSDGDTSDDDDEEEDINEEEIDEALDANIDDAVEYLLSGVPVSLQETLGSYLSIGGGYAVLQSSPTNSIVLEKINTKKKFTKQANSKQNLSLIIRSGDIVRVKLVDASTRGVKYLSLHRGWWLRWRSSKPQKNGSFYIRTNNDIGSTLIKLGSPFSLQSRKWSRFNVGAMQSSSAKFGGRMLGLYKADPTVDLLEPEEIDDIDIPQNVGMENKITPLSFFADYFNASHALSPEKTKRVPESNRLDIDIVEGDNLFEENQDVAFLRRRYDIDVPVYIEMMNRTNRTKQRVYAVRAKEYTSTETNEEGLLTGQVTMKLRTGHALASTLRLGLNEVGNTKSELPTNGLVFQPSDPVELDEDSDSSSSESETDDESQSSNFLIAGPNHFDVTILKESEDTNERSDQIQQEVELTPGSQTEGVDQTSESLVPFEGLTPGICSPPFDSSAPKRKRGNKHAAVLGKVAKTLKSSTVVTGKHVIKHSKYIGKGTVNAGRAAGRKLPSSVVHSKPPKKHEPKGRVNRKKTDYQAKALVKAMKRFDAPSGSGQLLAPDQMCRKVSHLLSEISSLALPSEQTSAAIFALVHTNSQSDLEFLRGGSAELGVVPLETINAEVDCEYVVARNIWEGRWREEACVLYSRGGHLSFYAPSTKKPSLVVSFDEIISVRKCDPTTDSNPLPGLRILAIDTTWRCHYLAFLENTALESFSSKLRESVFNSKDQAQPNRAQGWETFQLSLESTLTGTIGPKWAPVSTGRKSNQKKQRRVLNSRRLCFDLKPVSSNTANMSSVQGCIASYAENLLKMALSFSPDTLDATESSFIEFLDEASRLRSLPLHEIDFSSREALCIFVNLYHCLMQHSLLIAVDGLPNKVSMLCLRIYKIH